MSDVKGATSLLLTLLRSVTVAEARRSATFPPYDDEDGFILTVGGKDYTVTVRER